MPIPEAQLETWSHQGAIKGSSSTYQSIKAKLESKDAAYAGKNVEVFLQGSYGNDTNIYSESDVDIVIVLKDCFQSDRKSLSEVEQAAWRSAHHDATYTHADFKRDVLALLVDAYGAEVNVGDKAISIDASGTRRKADVIPAIQYRRYYKFNGLHDQRYDEGICFYNAAGECIANYPKQHSANLKTRHQAANQWLKPMVRIWKNLRTKLVEDGKIEAGAAPSYYIEGLLYNVPVEKFGSSYEASFVNAFNWLVTDADKTKLVCANEQYYLLRDSAHTCWEPAKCDAFLDAAAKLWKDW